MLKITKLKEIAHTEHILSVHVQTNNGKIAFNIVKGCKTKDYPDGNVANAWEKLKNNYEPISATLIGTLNKQLREWLLSWRTSVLFPKINS
jgi:hypothetical protein